MMASDNRFLDHVVISVGTKLDEAAETYRRLGFMVTERGHHTLGTSNHLAILQQDYLELLGVEPGKPMPATNLVAGPIGVSALAFKVRDCARLYRQLLAAGLPVQAPQSFSRPVTLPESTFDARFTISRLSPSPLEGVQMFFCQHLTPQLVWRADWQEHANGAIAISHLVMAAADPVQVVQLLGRLAEEHTSRRVEGGWEFDAGGLRVDVLEPGDVRKRLQVEVAVRTNTSARVVGIGVRTRSIAGVTEILSRARVLGDAHSGDCLVVPAREAMGVALEFTS